MLGVGVGVRVGVGVGVGVGGTAMVMGRRCHHPVCPCGSGGSSGRCAFSPTLSAKASTTQEASLHNNGRLGSRPAPARGTEKAASHTCPFGGASRRTLAGHAAFASRSRTATAHLHDVA
ncbi:hypothetical protein COCMIDRAFT_21647 [Bipolaris oryzae ATCC 44560]|uniref:Uncharacterized protein n=1 Tax=Bipolaris oryzae ATCC 44560 TaxID=930090 RepID=W6ZGH4_COCMI|nr:uncharacterized protein COCMIDRAFT_21647 [Bipolaris oryzae ATCC 44560]EUC50932.1 hypothetical protein COCMIDRAFT_21647 [Bipolaris oryzae ATCC 44560]